jgi:TRAP-type C4-dicarboxylate transport system substrate-binding protein
MKKSKIKAKTLLLMNLIVAAVLLWAVPMLPAADEIYQPRFSYHWFPEHQSAKMAELFVKECKIATKGRLDIQVFPSGQLFGVSQIVPAIAQGSVEIGGVVDVVYMRMDKDFYLMGFARFFNSFLQKRDFWLKNPEGRKAWDRLERKLGVKNICYIPIGPAIFASVDRPLVDLASFKGLRARTLLPTEKPTMQALGVNYVSVNTPEVYTALQQGMINMICTVPDALKAYGWWDFIKYVQTPYYLYSDAYITVNTRWWSSLPQDIRDIVLNEVAPKVSKIATDEIMKISKETLDEFVEKHGGHVSVLSGNELQKFVDLERNSVHPLLATNLDQEFYRAAKKYVGLE